MHAPAGRHLRRMQRFIVTYVAIWAALAIMNLGLLSLQIVILRPCDYAISQFLTPNSNRNDEPWSVTVLKAICWNICIGCLLCNVYTGGQSAEQSVYVFAVRRRIRRRVSRVIRRTAYRTHQRIVRQTMLRMPWGVHDMTLADDSERNGSTVVKDMWAIRGVLGYGMLFPFPWPLCVVTVVLLN